MTELLTAAQMRAIEQAAIDSGEVTGLELMERAGRGVVEAIFEEWPELACEDETGQGGAAPQTKPVAGGLAPQTPQDISRPKMHRAVVLCGPGNNGGDGFVVARLLHERGWEVEVFLYGDAEKLPPDARANFERWCELGAVSQMGGDEIDPSHLNHFDICVDAIFGTGLTRPIPSEIYYFLIVGLDAEVWDPFRGELSPRIVAVDMPSGLNSDNGRLLTDKTGVREIREEFPLSAVLTVTFHQAKRGQFIADGGEVCGKVVVAGIGLDTRAYWARNDFIKNKGDFVRVVGSPNFDARARHREPEGFLAGYRLRKQTEIHKYAHGHALILTGGSGKTGAARLAGRGALRIGAGLVTLGVPPSARMEVAGQITAIMQTRVSEGQELATLLQDTRLNALCLGPGMGLERARELVPVALLAQRATVLDADALTAFADQPKALFDQLHETCVLTPHGGEFARLFPDIAEKLNAPATEGPAYSKVDATREAAKRAGCVVLFKGPDTVIAAPDGRCSINSAHYDRAAPWLATAGSGDVLAGFITGLFARGFAPMQAAETAAWLHVECALEFGPGLIAEDLPEMLPKVFRKLKI
ncbi:NAD(P)H-hydrate dehydratase [Aliiroseovarius crassostreae]|uniref:NAD(P)H-hydrate dehydratase n=1 Tax=Aliiroseovarius crassostreae TaxID=154981 RepID=UPI003C7E6C90